ncbi:c-type cytochrome biogenesis protein CcmI [Sodalis sp. dw_96]|uniref:c-type cytochrome biogenesis protein CcmI n=1 Tax=Sodalis sp. dw_96 TaxID=2719794 RepID=UPI001BD62CC8
MALGVTMLVLLILAGGVFVLPALRHGPRPGALTRDGLNTLFYRRRLDELAHDEAEGVIIERSRHIEDLQQNLLADIPPGQQAPRRTLSAWVMLPGVVALVVVTLGFYAGTGGMGQLWRWQRTVDELPALRARIMDPKARQLTPEELSHFAVGLRASLQRQPDNLRDWLILGRIGVVLKDASMVTHAFERAWLLAPDDESIELDYADVLTRSADPGDNLDGNRLLLRFVQRRPDNLQALGLLAVSEYQQNNFSQAIILWQRLLTLLPANDAHVEIIKHSIALAREQSGQETAKLDVTVTLAPAIADKLPRRGVLFISATDGKSPQPVAVKTLPLSRFPLSLSLDDSNAMMPERSLSAQAQLKVRVRLSLDGTAEAKPGDWFGESAVQDFNGAGRIAVQIDQQVP